MSSDYIIEYKKSDADIEAAKMQIKYYMYTLSEKGITKNGKIEIIEKNKENKTIIIQYSEDLKEEIESLIREIEEYLSGTIESFEPSKKCKKCSYYEYCII